MNINRDLKLSFYCNKLSISRYFFSLAFYFSWGGGGGGGGGSGRREIETMASED